MIPLTTPVFTKEMEHAAIDTLNNEMFVGGESVNKFEEEFSHYIGTDYAVAVNSGSSALLLTFNALDLKARDKFAAPSATFIATLNGPTTLGGSPVFCEIGQDYLISAETLRAIGQEGDLKYVLPVHLYCHPCKMDEIKEASGEIIAIEDAAQAHGAKYKGKKIGSFGEAAIFSFYPTKNMTVAGDGGMVTTNNDKIHRSIKKMRDVGRLSKYNHDKIGYTLRLNSVNAAIGRVQLRYLDQWNEKRRSIANTYNKTLHNINDLILPPHGDKDSEPVYHMYVVRTRHRDKLGAWLAMNGISTGIHYPIPVHKQPAYSAYTANNLQFTEEWSKTVLSLPMFPLLESKDQSYVIDNIIRFFEEKQYVSEKVKEAEKEWLKKLT